MHASGYWVEKNEGRCMLPHEEEAFPLTLFISFNPKTECGQKCSNPSSF